MSSCSYSLMRASCSRHSSPAPAFEQPRDPIQAGGVLAPVKHIPLRPASELEPARRSSSTGWATLTRNRSATANERTDGRERESAPLARGLCPEAAAGSSRLARGPQCARSRSPPGRCHPPPFRSAERWHPGRDRASSGSAEFVDGRASAARGPLSYVAGVLREPIDGGRSGELHGGCLSDARWRHDGVYRSGGS